MIEKRLSPKKTLNKALLRKRLHRNEIELFKGNLRILLDRSNEFESEEFHKNLVSDFLKNTYYKNTNFINTKGRNDLVIHLGRNPEDLVGVVIEAKKPTNKAEMPSETSLNSKAFQELVLYYMRERFTVKNLEIRYLICSNIYEWFIFDAIFFERYFAQDAAFVKSYRDFDEGRLADITTSFFYREIAAPAISAVEDSIEYTYFDIRDYEKTLRSESKNEDSQLSSLFKLLSPQHLLKQPFNNDSNSLDKGFYSELLHLIGLVEIAEGGKQLIVRRAVGDRDGGSLIENTILQLDAMDKLERVPNRKNFGANKEEQLFNVALELAITWVNRILFLKLLEAQLLNFHKGEKEFAFLNLDKINSFESLNSLFFQVLARRPEDRNEEIKKKFPRTPYLNSSLFELSELEHQTLTISNLSDDRKIKILGSTVLKDSNGTKIKGSLNPIQYIIKFLDAFDFATDATEQIQEENKRLINASVLGLIFEKINGYKDGSFFTPGFVTMYMCRETIRKAVIQKFNEVKGWKCQSVDNLYDLITDNVEANNIINSLHICDPAVGSGHFLVSTLNELISIKNDLNILLDRTGRRLKEYNVDIVNDELVISDENGDLLEYKPSSKESQRVQEAIFHEKQTIIENCLFGVDINSNSVKICRLRLWIELLKNAYYTEDGNLETLPNIDINIKTGNSTISRFGLEDDLKQALKKSGRTLNDYKLAVATYRNANSKSQKHEMELLIAETKTNFRLEILSNHVLLRRLHSLQETYNTLKGQLVLFEETKKEKATRNKKLEELLGGIRKLEKQIETINSNKIYEDAFEWRFEFPEVLGDSGQFIGFDVVIANPPYIDSEKMVRDGHEDVREYLSQAYTCAKGNWDLYIIFMELSLNLLKETGNMMYITPDKWIAKPFGNEFRTQHFGKIEKVVMLGRGVFESAKVDSIMTLFSKLQTPVISTASFESEGVLPLNQVPKSEIQTPYYLDALLSKHYGFVRKLELIPGRLENVIQCESACATSDAYKLKPLVIDATVGFDESKFYRVINTGTLGKYVSRWGIKPMTYLKDKYLYPVINREEFAQHFKNTYKAKSDAKKIIVKGLTLLDAALDLEGNVVPGKSTLILASPKENLLKYISAILNSPIAIFYIKSKYGSSSYNGGINFTKDMINALPLPLNEEKMSSIVKEVNAILNRKAKDHSSDIQDLENSINLQLYERYIYHKTLSFHLKISILE